MAEVRFDHATLTYPGNSSPAVDALDLTVNDGEFLVLVGPSGCGKTTALRMLAGLENVDVGRVYIGDRDVTDLPPKERDVAMVFQNYALYPHMTVAQNMSFALRISHVPKPEIRRRVEEAARMLDLTDYLSRRPRALSGGQRQRVAMGRAIVREPQVFLMDEPLSNLDAKLRVQTRTQIAELQRRLSITTVYVTHDQVEAMTMGDRVAVMRNGVLHQVDTPHAIFTKPANTFVAGFVGSPPMNLIDVPVADDGGLELGPIRVPLSDAVAAYVCSQGFPRLVLGLRPEQWHEVSPDKGVPVDVLVVEELGSDSYVHCVAVLEGNRVPLIVRHGAGPVPAKGARIGLQPSEQQPYLFAPDSGQRLDLA